MQRVIARKLILAYYCRFDELKGNSANLSRCL
jgi:hypothetical protein